MYAYSSIHWVKKFHEWQAYMQKEAYVVPMYNYYNITAVNSKLVNYSLKPSQSGLVWYKTGFKK